MFGRLDRSCLRLIAYISGSGAAALAKRLWHQMFLLTRFMAVQAVAQAFSLIAGFVIVRVLEKQDYALYTLTISGMLALFALLDCGIVDAATAFGGRAWNDPVYMGQVLASATAVRNRLAVVVIIPTIAIQGWLLTRNGAELGQAIFLLIAICLAATLHSSCELLRVILRLGSRIWQVQSLDVMDAALRASLAIVLIPFLDVNVAVLIAITGACLVYFVARRWVSRSIDLGASSDVNLQDQIRSVVRRHWLYVATSVYQGQLSLLLMGLFGGSVAVADLGALGRIAAFFATFTAAMQSIVLPRYARCKEAHELRKLYLAAFSACAAIALLPVIATLVIPQPLLWILGAKYQNLSHELFLVTLASGMVFLSEMTWGLNSVRAWIVPSWIMVPASLGSSVILMKLIGISTMQEVIWIGILSSFVVMLVNISAALIFFQRIKTA